MSEIHVRQIKSYLEKVYRGLIDESDLNSSVEEDNTRKFLSRAVASYALSSQIDITPEYAALAITDGTSDNGIDAIFHDTESSTLFIVQAKWRDDGNGGVTLDAAQKLVKGVKDLLNARYGRFNDKINAKKHEIELALNGLTRIRMVFAHTGNCDIGSEVQVVFDDFLSEMNDAGEVLAFNIFKLSDLHKSLIDGGKPDSIDIELSLSNWGPVTEPYMAFYGQISALDVANLYKEHGLDLFEPNLRSYLGSTEVNKAISQTLANDPGRFWYYNNGITALCDSITKLAKQSGDRRAGTFQCNGLRIVNGAQTVGAIASSSAGLLSKSEDANVHLRIISLEDCPEGFGTAITIATNTQNRIERRDFVAADKEQQRIKGELAIDEITYVLKSGERTKDRQNGFDINDATVALACAQQDLGFAMTAKREISLFWEDLSSSSYRALFNPSLSGAKLWRFVQIQRKIDEAIISEAKHVNDFSNKVSVHGNRLIAHEVYSRLDLLDIELNDVKQQACLREIPGLVKKLLVTVPTIIDEKFPDAVLSGVFKNVTKCRIIHEEIIKKLNGDMGVDDEFVGDLFSNAQ